MNYGLGNFGSLLNMFRRIGAKASLENDPDKIIKAKKLILPGVGAFDTAINKINNQIGLREVLNQKAMKDKVPILGICLGMQILTSKSKSYFEQMKGRGTRTINSDSLQLVSRTAKTKTHFVIVDAVGATKSKKTDSRPLERKPTVPMKDLLGAVTMGVADEDLFLSLANRLIRLEKQITEKEKDKLLEFSGGKNLKQITKELITAYDQDAIETRAQLEIDKIPVQDQTPALIEEAKKHAQNALILEATKTFNGELNEYLDNVRKQHEQIIDSINIDTVTKSEWETTSVDKATQIIKDFSI